MITVTYCQLPCTPKAVCIHRLFRWDVFPYTLFDCYIVMDHSDNEQFGLGNGRSFRLEPESIVPIVLRTSDLLTRSIENEHGHSFEHTTKEYGTWEQSMNVQP